MRKYPDPLSVKYGNNKLQPYWTGYAYTLQSQLDQITVSKYTNITLTHSFQRMQELIKSNIPSSMYFEVIVSFSWTVLLVLATLLASNNRGSNHLVLRRLGVKQWQFWLGNFFFVWLPTLVCCLLMAVIWHYTGVTPFSGLTIGFCLFQMVLLSLLLSTSALFLSAILNGTGATIVSCLLGFFLIVLPTIVHVAAFRGYTIFDPSLVPQWGIWFSMSVLPVFSSVGILDSMTSSVFYNTSDLS